MSKLTVNSVGQSPTQAQTSDFPNASTSENIPRVAIDARGPTPAFSLPPIFEDYFDEAGSGRDPQAAISVTKPKKPE